jgi:HSP20 family molecular chaperone IbpA
MSLIRNRPFYHPFESLFDVMRDGAFAPQSRSVIVPSYSTRRTKDADNITIELPGVPKETLKLDIKSHFLIVSGSRPDPDAPTEPQLTEQTERSTDRNGKSDKGEVGEGNADEQYDGHIHYEVRVMLSERLDVDSISADYKDGLLCVRVPHRGDVKQTRSITIS